MMRGFLAFLSGGLILGSIAGCASSAFQFGKTTIAEMETAMGRPKTVRQSADGGMVMAWEIDQRAYAFASDVPRMLVIATFDKSGLMTGMRRTGSLYTPIPVPILPLAPVRINSVEAGPLPGVGVLPERKR